MPHENLIDLASLGRYRIARGEPDPRGWTVVGAEGIEVATVVSLLVQLDALKARYFICDFSDPPRQAVLPVVYARLDTKNRRVIFDMTATSAFLALPPFSGAIDQAAEAKIHALIIGEVIELPPPAPSLDRRQGGRRDPE